MDADFSNTKVYAASSLNGGAGKCLSRSLYGGVLWRKQLEIKSSIEQEDQCA